MAKQKKSPSKEQQKAIAFRNGTAVVSAAAGSGKTSVIERRARALVSDHEDARQILIVSYTNKAAEEIRTRVTAPQVEGVAVSTVHSLGLKILREYHIQTRLPATFSIATAQYQAQLMDDVRATIKAKGMARIPSSKVLRETISYHRNTGASLKASLRATNPGTVASMRVLRKAIKRYESLKAESGLVDFDDLIIMPEQLLATDNDIRRELKRRYRHIMVDEFQDLNRTQLRLLQHLGGAPRKDRSLMFVGDPGQSIFGFRGACFQNWAEVRDGAEKLPLPVNFRSSAPIVALSNAIDDFTSVDRPATRARKNAPSSPKPRLSVYPDAKSEAAAICDQIERLQEKSYPLSEQAILFRDSNFIRHVIAELRARKIPYRKIGGLSYPPPPLVRDVMAVLEVGANPNHIPALMHVLQLLPGIGPMRVRKLLSQLKPSTSRNGLISLLREELAGRPGSRHLVHALKATDPTSPSVASVIENVVRAIVKLNNELERGSSSLRGENAMDAIFEQAEGATTLLDVVNFWALHSNDDNTTDSIDYVSVSTIHGAKGREWSVVYIPQLIDDHLPHSKCSTDHQVAEERRIFYVAVTRAKRYLYLSHTAGTGTKSHSSGKPSRFLDLPGVMDLLKYREVAK